MPILDGEEWWSSQAIDHTDSVIKSLLDLTKSCIELKIMLEHSEQLYAELNLHNFTHNVTFETDKCLTFCACLRNTEISKKAGNVQNKLNAYVSKQLKK